MKNIKYIIVFLVLFATVFGAFIMGFKYSCDKPGSLDYSQRQLCWYKKIKIEMDRHGVESALKFLGALYRRYPSFAGSCHDVTHLIGGATYKDYKVGKKFTFSEETSWCGYGFYHGFIENMLTTKNGYKEARDFCETIHDSPVGDIVAPIAMYSCYHGIGHATFDNHEPGFVGVAREMVTPAISACEVATHDLEFEKTKQCVTGVFNALANAYGINNYGLIIDAKDPVGICRSQPEKYRKYCFSEVAMTWINSTMGHYDFKFEDGATYIQSIGDWEGEKSATNALASEYGHLHQNSLTDADLIKNCRSIRENLFDSCMYGSLLAILNWGTPGAEYKRAISFCGTSTLSNADKDNCFSYVFNDLPTHYSRNKLNAICKTVPPEYKEKCNSIR